MPHHPRQLPGEPGNRFFLGGNRRLAVDRFEGDLPLRNGSGETIGDRGALIDEAGDGFPGELVDQHRGGRAHVGPAGLAGEERHFPEEVPRAKGSDTDRIVGRLRSNEHVECPFGDHVEGVAFVPLGDDDGVGGKHESAEVSGQREPIGGFERGKQGRAREQGSSRLGACIDIFPLGEPFVKHLGLLDRGGQAGYGHVLEHAGHHRIAGRGGGERVPGLDPVADQILDAPLGGGVDEHDRRTVGESSRARQRPDAAQEDAFGPVAGNARIELDRALVSGGQAGTGIVCHDPFRQRGIGNDDERAVFRFQYRGSPADLADFPGYGGGDGGDLDPIAEHDVAIAIDRQPRKEIGENPPDGETENHAAGAERGEESGHALIKHHPDNDRDTDQEDDHRHQRLEDRRHLAAEGSRDETVPDDRVDQPIDELGASEHRQRRKELAQPGRPPLGLDDLEERFERTGEPDAEQGEANNSQGGDGCGAELAVGWHGSSAEENSRRTMSHPEVLSIPQKSGRADPPTSRQDRRLTKKKEI